MRHAAAASPGRVGRGVLLTGILVAGAPAAAQTEAGPSAAMIVVTAPPAPGRVLAPAVTLGSEALLDRQPRSIADALRGLPGVSVRPNSRGETVPRVRGSEERQTQVFLDGAPLTVPWDGRIDLGLLPAGLIGAVEVRKGAVPIEYGTNAVAGVVDLRSRDTIGFTGVAQLGSKGLATLSAVGSFALGPATVTLGGAHQSVDALVVADLAALPFSQAPDGRRTNSASDADSLFAAITATTGGIAWRASILHFTAVRQIAPESDRNPALFAPRYWRYPDIDFTQAQVSAEARLAEDTSLRLTGWRQWFGQTIDAYRDIGYTALRSREQNDDDTLGGRLTFNHPAGPLALRWSASATAADHLQRDTAFPPGTGGPWLRYRQVNVSAGLEADLPLSPRTGVTAGIGYDRSDNVRTGDKPAQPVKDAVAFSGALRHAFDDRLTLVLSGGRRTRFPSARELFGEALGRFLANPALAPETAWLADAELSWRRNGMTVTLNPFLLRADGTISQRVVRVGNQSLRQRFNLSGSTSYGVDGLVLVPIGETLTAEITGSWLEAHADAGSRLVQRPDHEVMLAIDWAPRRHGERLFDLRSEVRRIGPAVDLAPDGTTARLPAATEWNLRAALPLGRIGATHVWLTAAADNLTNAVVVPQLGLPLPGRTVRFGIRVE